jgi:single-strand DNA-binding protein
MEIVGRLTEDAKLETLNDERKVIHFSLAVNDSYRPKGGDVVKLTNFFRCSYWKNANLTEHLKKGTLVEISGRVGVNAWVDSNGEAKASLTFNVNTIKLHGRPNRNEEVPLSAPTDAIHPTEEKENLPF